MRDILILAEFTFREARRRRVLWAGMIMGLVYIALYGVGFYFIHRDMMRQMTRVGALGRTVAHDAGFNFVVMAGLYVVSFLGVMLAVLTAVSAIAGEINSLTIHALAARPLRRSAILLGRWLGLALMLALYIAFLAGGVVGVTAIISGYIPPNVVAGVSLIVLQAWIMLSLSLLLGTMLSVVANGVAAFMLYGVAFVGGWIEQVGAALSNDAAVEIGIVTSLLVPSEAMWKMGASLMQSPVVNALGTTPFAAVSAPSTAMLIYALIYVLVAMGLAVRSLNRRDL